MARYAVLRSFYTSDRWQRFRAAIIADRGSVCAKCGKIIVNPLDCELDHINELSPENVNDVTVSLNPDNIQILCHSCHDQKHNRFGYQPEHGVFLVFGPPMSGQEEYVEAHMQHGDLVIDVDKLFCAVSLLPEYDKPTGLLKNVLGLRDLLIDNVKTRFGKWSSAWIIGGYEDKYKREKVAEDTGAAIIFCDVSKEECKRRLDADESLKYRKDEYANYIDRWFERYVP